MKRKTLDFFSLRLWLFFSVSWEWMLVWILFFSSTLELLLLLLLLLLLALRGDAERFRGERERFAGDAERLRGGDAERLRGDGERLRATGDGDCLRAGEGECLRDFLASASLLDSSAGGYLSQKKKCSLSGGSWPEFVMRISLTYKRTKWRNKWDKTGKMHELLRKHTRLGDQFYQFAGFPFCQRFQDHQPPCRKRHAFWNIKTDKPIFLPVKVGSSFSGSILSEIWLNRHSHEELRAVRIGTPISHWQ
jgi:hypothetical protein